MKSQDVIAVLRLNADTLRARGVKHAALFGSVARGDDGPDSDIDILVELDPTAKVDLFAYVELRTFMAELFPGSGRYRKQRALKPHVRPPAESDANLCVLDPLQIGFRTSWTISPWRVRFLEPCRSRNSVRTRGPSTRRCGVLKSSPKRPDACP